MMTSFEITKKQRYMAHAILTTAILYFFIQTLPEVNYLLISLLTFFVIVGSYFVHRPNTRLVNTLVTSIMQFALVGGFILSIIFFPSLSDLFRLAALFSFMVMFYLISLVNNVFLVVNNRGEPIPLYRVAITWSKILIAAVSIPLFAGIFKISVNSFAEAIVISLISALFYLYLVWFLQYNPDVKKYRVGELLTIFALGSFIVPVVSLSLSFPTPVPN